MSISWCVRKVIDDEDREVNVATQLDFRGFLFDDNAPLQFDLLRKQV